MYTYYISLHCYLYDSVTIAVLCGNRKRRDLERHDGLKWRHQCGLLRRRRTVCQQDDTTQRRRDKKANRSIRTFLLTCWTIDVAVVERPRVSGTLHWTLSNYGSILHRFEIFDFRKYCNLEIRVRNHSKAIETSTIRALVIGALEIVGLLLLLFDSLPMVSYYCPILWF